MQIDPLRRWLGPVWWVMHRKFYVDEFYAYTILPFTRGAGQVHLLGGRPVDHRPDRQRHRQRSPSAIATFCGDVDRYVVDGVVNGFAWLASKAGAILRNAQNGQVQVYLMVVVVSVTIWLLLTALPMLLTLV